MASGGVGRLEVICGCMFAGKTTELIRRLAAARGAGLRVGAFKPRRDTRSGERAIKTHTGQTIEAIPVDSAEEIAAAAMGMDVMAVDEAHFFGSALVAPCMTLLGSGRRVIVAGVERDHRGMAFEPFPALLIEADEVVKLAAACARCGGPAVHSQRMTGGTGRIVVGGAGDYEPRCRECFEPGRE